MDCVVDYGAAGLWLRVPLGKMNIERSVPLDEATAAVLSERSAHRLTQRRCPPSRADKVRAQATR